MTLLNKMRVPSPASERRRTTELPLGGTGIALSCPRVWKHLERPFSGSEYETAHVARLVHRRAARHVRRGEAARQGIAEDGEGGGQPAASPGFRAAPYGNGAA